MKALWQICWWAAFTLILACLFLSLSYTFGEALFIATLYLPGIFLLRQWLPQLPARTTAESEWDEDEGPLTRRKWLSCAGFFLALILLETLLVLLAHLLVLSPPDNPLAVTSPVLLYNPVLALIILGAGYGWGLLMEWSRKRWLPEKEPTIDFVSDRQKVSVPIASILFIESRDTEVYIHLRRRDGLPQQDAHLPLGIHPRQRLPPHPPGLSGQRRPHRAHHPRRRLPRRPIPPPVPEVPGQREIGCRARWGPFLCPGP